jgi:hypothetical protein
MGLGLQAPLWISIFHRTVVFCLMVGWLIQASCFRFINRFFSFEVYVAAPGQSINILGTTHMLDKGCLPPSPSRSCDLIRSRLGWLKDST